MATTNYNHVTLTMLDSDGNQNVMYPETTAKDVKIDRTTNTKIPSTVSTAQDLVDTLGAFAFKESIEATDLDADTFSQYVFSEDSTATSASATVSVDADTLAGHDPSYFATSAEVSELSATATSISNTLATKETSTKTLYSIAETTSPGITITSGSSYTKDGLDLPTGIYIITVYVNFISGTNDTSGSRAIMIEQLDSLGNWLEQTACKIPYTTYGPTAISFPMIYTNSSEDVANLRIRLFTGGTVDVNAYFEVKAIRIGQ